MSFVNCYCSTHRDSGKLYNMARCDEYNVDEKRIAAAWMTSIRDEYDVNEDDGEAADSKDDSKYHASRRSTSFMNC